jgi:Histidine kinase-, DNA gyrase B-, and HSP90-like ATPase
MAQTEKRTFGMHPNLLFDVILRQAGSLQKALLEGVMNAIDAGATRCDLTLESTRFVVEDNGHGIKTKKEIEEFFETFGTPHVEGDAVYGRFRMGRGQMMAFGRNIWRSRTFEMDVDIKKTGLDYTLTEHAEDFQGTRITGELYEAIPASDLERIKSEMRRYVAWAPVPIYLNGDRISQDTSQGKWTYEDADAHYALSTERNQLSVYNRGVLVNQFHAGRFGIGGTIVSKAQLEVNFARNDVQSSCPIFKRIQAYMRKQTGEASVKKTKLTDAERDLMARDFVTGSLVHNTTLELRILTDVQGRAWPLSKLLRVPYDFQGKIFVADRGDKLGESAQMRGLAFTIDEGTLERFGANDVASFLERLAQGAELMSQRTGGNSSYMFRHLAEIARTQLKVCTRTELLLVLNDGYTPLTPKELTADLKLLQSTLQAASWTLAQAMNEVGYEDLKFQHRRIVLGRSEMAHAWTNGTDTIWVNVEHARLLRKGYAGAHQLALTLVHEMIHTGPNTGTHQHDLAFYQAYHDFTTARADPVGRTAEKLVSRFIAGLRAAKKPIGQQMFKRDDTDLALAKAKAFHDAGEDSMA